MAEDRKQSSEYRDKDEPVSLAPLSPEEALRALLAVKPDGSPCTPTEGQHEDSRNES